MALGKPVVTFLHDEAVRRTRGGVRRPRPDRHRDEGDARARRCGRSSRTPPPARARRRLPRLRRARARHRAGRRPPARPLRSPLDDGAGRADEAARPALGDLRARRDRLARDRRLPAAALHALPRAGRLRRGRPGRRPLGGARDDPARRDLERVLPLLLRLDGRGAAAARRSARRSGSRWRARRSASSPASCSPSRSPTCSTLDDPKLVRAGFVGLWAQMNYEQLTALFRVEERSAAFVLASLANVAVTIGATILLVVVCEQGALGVIVGNFIGTLVVYLALLGSPRAARAPVLAAAAARDEPLRRAARPRGARADRVNFSDRFFLDHLGEPRRGRACTSSASGSRRRWCC